MKIINKIKSLISDNNPTIDDWDNIIISKKGTSEDDTHIYNNAIINISFPVKPKLSCQTNKCGNDYVYKYTASYANQSFGLVLEKHYCWEEYYGNVAYGCIETKSYEEIIKEKKDKPYVFLKSHLGGFIQELIKETDSSEKESCNYVIKRRFFHHGFNIIEYFIDDVRLFNNDSFAKGQLFLFGDDMLLSHLYVTSKTKSVFNEDYYRFFVNSFRCHLNTKDYILERGKNLKIKTKSAKEKIGNISDVLLNKLKNNKNHK